MDGVYRNYYSYSDMPQRPKCEEPEKAQLIRAEVHKKEKQEPQSMLKKEKGRQKAENDDLILIAVAIILFTGECDDVLLLLAIVFIFLSGREGNSI